MLQESGHLHPTFKLARQLRQQGFDVAYFAGSELRAMVEDQGFRVLPWFDPPEASRSGSLLRKRRAVTRAFEQMTSTLSRGEGPAKLLAELRPALTLVDVTVPTLSFALHAAGRPFALVHTSLPQTRDPGVPPLRVLSGYRGSFVGRVKSQLAWQRFLVRRRLSAELVRPFGLAPPYEISRRKSAAFGIAQGQLDCATVYMPQLRDARQLVLCPQAFDFPRSPAPERYYVESVDTERLEGDFPWQRLSPTLPLVFASLGSQLYRGRASRRFLGRLLQVFATRPEWQLVMSLGRHAAASDFDSCPRNAILVERAPQLALLRRAQVMVTHGGLGSIKECILHGVPMLVVPLAVDQPGNAARVLHHGLGVSADVRRASAGQLAHQLSHLLDDESVRANLARMRRNFEHVEASGAGAQRVAEWARASAADHAR